ncbi:MAG TPA: hypothetical protein VGB82_26685 [Alphaproteobacteria bacterium]
MGPHPELPRLGISAAFTSHNLCGLGVSPEIRLIKPPSAAATYQMKMTLVSALSAPSWEFTLPAPTETRERGIVYPEGAIPDFPAPCVPETEVPQYFYYRLELMARANDGRPIAYGWSFAVAYSLTRQLGLERVQTVVRQRERAAAAARGQTLPDDQATTTPAPRRGPAGMLAAPVEQSPTAAQERPAGQAPDAAASASGASTQAPSGAAAPSASQSSASQRTAASPAPPSVPPGPRIVPYQPYPSETSAYFFIY